MSTITETKVLDCQGMNCPLPILKTKKEIDKMESGEILKMVSTDPGSTNDVMAWAKKTGNVLLDNSQDGNVYTFFIQKS
jgi:tRNA 2-thiouridine synthesizing protein A